LSPHFTHGCLFDKVRPEQKIDLRNQFRADLEQSGLDPDEVQQLLAEIYGWFTEGFDTKDLQEAQALLEELP
jgi:predicted ATPase